MLEFGGGFSRAKLRSYLDKLGVEYPRIIVREIAPGGNRPLNRPGTLSPDAEVYMDLEILASVAPHATLVVYFAENSSRGWIEAIQAAIFDRKHRISVLSVSWGQAEMYWDAQTIAALEAPSADGGAAGNHGVLFFWRSRCIRSQHSTIFGAIPGIESARIGVRRFPARNSL